MVFFAFVEIKLAKVSSSVGTSEILLLRAAALLRFPQIHFDVSLEKYIYIYTVVDLESQGATAPRIKRKNAPAKTPGHRKNSKKSEKLLQSIERTKDLLAVNPYQLAYRQLCNS